jgi:hypothetical protein
VTPRALNNRNLIVGSTFDFAMDWRTPSRFGDFSA